MAPASAGAEALILVPTREEKPVQDPVQLNPVGQWAIGLAWVALVVVNLWTWRMILKKRPSAGREPGSSTL
jgi:hypothetical protein